MNDHLPTQSITYMRKSEMQNISKRSLLFVLLPLLLLCSSTTNVLCRGQQQRGDHNQQTSPWGSTPSALAAKWSAPNIPPQSYADIATVLTLHAIDDYMSHTVHATNDTYYAPTWDQCHLHYPFCAEMAAMGYCTNLEHEARMVLKCAPTCQTCHLLSRETQCNYHDHESARHLDALQPGDLHQLFGWMASSPELVGRYGRRTVHSRDPYLISFEDFLTPEECQRLIYYGHNLGKGFRSSKVRGSGDGRNESFVGVAAQNRTSSTNWINHEALKDHAIVGIQRKLEDVTQHRFEENNFEYMQVLRYAEGQKYDHHLDYFPPHGQKAHGHRVLTVFLYLNDVEEGGETHFRDLVGEDGAGSAEGIAISPKAGRMVTWPSVLNEAPNDKDRRTFHGSLPVKKGIKYGANAWVSC